uniref:TIGR04255 family protein n=1 Tax=Schlesneria paludicola TaxID=360056 RepID=A0A7C4LQV7_9PLAN
MNRYASLADDYFVNMNLNTEMQLPAARETVLGFFERIQKQYPSMRNFYTRENGDFVLEEDKDNGQQRWVSLEPRRICSGYVNPDRVEQAFEQHALLLDLVPYMLSVSPLDCEALDYMMGFDFAYRGNHDALVAEALGASSAFEGLIELPGAQVLNFEPSITISLEESCRRQARLMIETRTNAYQVRRGEFPEEQISVYFTVRQYGSLESDTSYVQTLWQLRSTCEQLLERCVIDQVLRPLQQAISAK